MMVGGAFILLNVGCGRRETASQAEIRLAGLLAILVILLITARKSLAIRDIVASCHNFHGICLIRRNRLFCYPVHSLSPKISAVSSKGGQDKDEESTGIIFYT
jgi:hypothetical protein